MQNTNDLLRDIAHELQTPITSAKGFVELVQLHGPMTENQQRFSNRALEVLLHMEQMVERLANLAWMGQDQPLKLDSTDLRDVIDRAIDLLEYQAKPRHITIEVKYAPRLGKIQGEERRLDQVMINLLGNAIKYNRDGGTVLVTAEGNKNEVRVTVRDTGQGILPEEQEHIFEHYFRAQASRQYRIEGQGLGLAIVKAVVEKHGGRIWVESQPGEGTSFIFVLPRRPRKTEDVTRDAAEQDAESKTAILESAPTSEFTAPPATGERSDAVDDDLQEPPQANLSDAERRDRSALQA